MAPRAVIPGMDSVLPLPEVLEPVGGELGVAGGVLDVAVAEPFLDGAGIVLAMGEGEAAGMAQHVRVDGEGLAHLDVAERASLFDRRAGFAARPIGQGARLRSRLCTRRRDGWPRCGIDVPRRC